MMNDSYDPQQTADTQRPEPPLPPSTPPEPTSALTAPARASSARDKTPAVAVILSLILPGLGHLYAEAYQRGAMVFASFVLIIFAAARGALPVALSVLSCTFLWFYGMFDSYREAQIMSLDAPEHVPTRSERNDGRLLFGIFLAVVGGLLLVENLGLFDLDWLRDWWPVLVVAIGIYLVVAAARERNQRRAAARAESEVDLDRD